MWIANEAADRFGLVSFSDDLPDVGNVRELIGQEPQVVEEFDVLRLAPTAMPITAGV